MNDVKREFASFGAFVEQVKKPGHERNGTSSVNSFGLEWSGGHTFDECIELAKTGWPDGLARMQKLTKLIEVPKGARNFEPQPVLALAGDEVDVGLYLTGEPECMTDWHMEETPTFGKVVKVIVSQAAMGSVSPDTMFRRGAAAVLLVDALESCGIRCEVWVLPKCNATSKGKFRFYGKVLVKKAEDPVELDRLAFMLAHPGVLRRLGFRLMEQEDPDTWAGKQTHNGYGSSKELVEAMQEDGTIYFGCQNPAYRNEEAMIAEVQRILDKFLEC